MSPKVVLADGKKTQPVVSACKKIAARTKPWEVETKSQVDLGRPTNDAAAKAGAFWESVECC